MERQTVSLTTELNLCCSCGICKGICPKQCISWQKKDGMFQPIINESICIQCGLCADICPGLIHDYGEPLKTDVDAVKGTVSASYNAWSCNEAIRHVSASGGVISTVIQALLDAGVYDLAFMVDSYDYHKQLCTVPVYANDLKILSTSNYPKSRYLPVSHENAASYIRSHRDKRVIIIGVSCAIRGMVNLINTLKLNRDNYLLIGLFCDKVFNYNVIDYFSQELFCKGKNLIALHFKNKESGGWPGNMKFFYSDGSSQFFDKSERVKIKEFFMPERCLYCIDKLNIYSDISLGDNYTNHDSSDLGSNSVIIRTEYGKSAWNLADKMIEKRPIPFDCFLTAQGMDLRLINNCYAKLKEHSVLTQHAQVITLNKNAETLRNIRTYKKEWGQSLTMLHAGAVFDTDPDELARQMNKVKLKKQLKNLQFFATNVWYHLRKPFTVKK